MFNHFFRKGNDPKKKINDNVHSVSALINDSLEVIPSVYQDIGNRECQEDAFALSDMMDRDMVANSGILAVVADGMGGLALGQVASNTAVEVFLREYRPINHDEPPQARLQRALSTANTAVFDSAYVDGVEVDLGTTLAAVLICKGKMYWVSVGDSYIYLYRSGELLQLTHEHIYKNKLMEEVHNGRITREEAENHPEGAYLTSFLGLPELPEIDSSKTPLTIEPGDRIILCSDGLSNSLSAAEIGELFANGNSVSAESLIRTALAKEERHQDNVTVVILSCQSVDKQ